MIDNLLYVSIFLIWAMLFYHMMLIQGGYYFSLRYQKQMNRWLERNQWLERIRDLPTVSILIPAHNEEVVIEKTIQSMLELNYPKQKLEVIIINDNSSDATGIIADSYARKYSFVHVLHNQPPVGGKGKSGALNAGLKIATGEYIIVYDADNTPEPNAVRNLALTLQNDPKAGAVVGKFRVINAEKNLLTRFINIETITFQWLAQAGRWFWFKLTTIPGTNFAIRRSILDKLGGWDEKALSEDTELSIRVYHLNYYIRMNPSAITWEQEPELWRVWWKQRTRWARGNMYVIGKYLFKFHKLNNKKIFIDLMYFLFTYFLFFAGILISHTIFITNLFVDLEISIGHVSVVLLITGFLLFVTEVLLALSIEEKQLTPRNAVVVLLMYFMYSQIWLTLIVYAACLEMKRVVFRQEVKWYKTQRFQEGATRKQVQNYQDKQVVPIRKYVERRVVK
ncbi:glycosyltransferase [Ornithinibacillus sp. 4-3]|uniref:Glycosyltransferase n=1 Tax=Ornithinibacillus sp. 4-3 TaxID=3231488 RepID=A0AB39HSM5_9BACI